MDESSNPSDIPIAQPVGWRETTRRIFGLPEQPVSRHTGRERWGQSAIHDPIGRAFPGLNHPPSSFAERSESGSDCHKRR